MIRIWTKTVTEEVEWSECEKPFKHKIVKVWVGVGEGEGGMKEDLKVRLAQPDGGGHSLSRESKKSSRL